MRRIIVHAGFHKTGTTSLQTFLADNQSVLAPHVQVVIRDALGPAFHAGRRFGYHRNGPTFRHAFAAFARSLPDDPRPLLISREGLSGLMPGLTRLGPFARVRDYPAQAIPLARMITRGLTARFPGAQVEFVYTTRAREAWLRSVWAHLLRDTGLRLDLEQFARRMPAAPLPEQASQIARALPGQTVHILDIDAYADHPLGPGGIVTDLLDLPEGLSFAPVRYRHAGPGAALARDLLALNRRRAPRAEKAALLAKGPAK